MALDQLDQKLWVALACPTRGIEFDTKTLDLINKGEAGFLDRDIYPFCFNVSDGKILAVASNNAKPFLGTDISITVAFLI